MLSRALAVPADTAARMLLGAILTRTIDGKTVKVSIVETEAYSTDDAASHSSKGITPRTKVMFGPAGVLYVYFTYGMHYCCNVVTGSVGDGSAVLIRAVQPLEGLETLSANRKGAAGATITNGPAKLCQALQIDSDFNGHSLEHVPFVLTLQPELPAAKIVQTTRIGISKATATPWRFYIKDNPYVSKL